MNEQQIREIAEAEVRRHLAPAKNKMSEQQIREIAEAAFKRHFSGVKMLRVNIRPRLGFADDSPVVDVNIIYDGKYEQLNGAGLLRVQSDIVSKAWREVEEDLGFPLVHFYAKSDLDLSRRDPATV